MINNYNVASRLLWKRGLDLNWFLSSIIEDGGEGVIMQRKGSLYEQGRSSSLVKLKVSNKRREK